MLDTSSDEEENVPLCGVLVTIRHLLWAPESATPPKSRDVQHTALRAGNAGNETDDDSWGWFLFLEDGGA